MMGNDAVLSLRSYRVIRIKSVRESGDIVSKWEASDTGRRTHDTVQEAQRLITHTSSMFVLLMAANSTSSVLGMFFTLQVCIAYSVEENILSLRTISNSSSIIDYSSFLDGQLNSRIRAFTHDESCLRSGRWLIFIWFWISTERVFKVGAACVYKELDCGFCLCDIFLW